MKYILDTNVLLWYIESSEHLPPNYSDIINNGMNEIFMSIVSLWEISIKHSLRKMQLSVSLEEFFYDIEYGFGFVILPIDVRDLIMLNRLPYLHKDPFDRLIYVSAKTNGMNLLYTDCIFEEYDKLL